MTYDAIGNITSKTGVGSYVYPTSGSAPRHAPSSVNGGAYTYDANGNTLTGGGRTFTWTADNLLATVGGESYSYDADGERVVRTAGGVTTVYFEGVWEQTTGGARKLYYTFNGQVVAMRDMSVTPNVVTYLHGDHLGSVSVATDSNGTGYSTQEYDPWGAVRAGGIGATTLGYTGQRLDASGLLYYHARYYNPVLARFVSADSVVPSSASGGMDGVQLRPLTVDFHEPGFATQIGGENNQPFWFQMSDEQRQQAGSPWGPQNPQALNRYSYVLNGPLKYKDPSGHTWYLTPGQAGQLVNALHELAAFVKDTVTLTGFASALTGAVTGLIAKYALSETAAAILTGLASGVIAMAAVAAIGLIGGAGAIYYAGMQIDQLAYQIQDYTDPVYGVALAYDHGELLMLNRKTGQTGAWAPPWWIAWNLPTSLGFGTIVGDPSVRDQNGRNVPGNVFPEDCRSIESSSHGGTRCLP